MVNTTASVMTLRGWNVGEIRERKKKTEIVNIFSFFLHLICFQLLRSTDCYSEPRSRPWTREHIGQEDHEIRAVSDSKPADSERRSVWRNSYYTGSAKNSLLTALISKKCPYFTRIIQNVYKYIAYCTRLVLICVQFRLLNTIYHLTAYRCFRHVNVN